MDRHGLSERRACELANLHRSVFQYEKQCDGDEALRKRLRELANERRRFVQLEQLVADYKRAMFGGRSEKACPEQYELALEDIETAQEAVHAEDEADDRQVSGNPRPRKTNRGSLPKHLPRIEEVIAPENTTCACGHTRHVIGEDVSERLDIVPAQFRVIVTRRPDATLTSELKQYGNPVSQQNLAQAGVNHKFGECIGREIHDRGLFRFGSDLLSHALRRSTIGATALNGRVRDGTGCFACAMTTKPKKTSVRPSHVLIS